MSDSSNAYFYAELISNGNMPDRVRYDIIGCNPDVDTTTTPETIWCTGGIYIFPTSPTVVTIVSDSADDALTGIGGQTVLVDGLNEDYDIITELVEMDGLTPVTTTQEFFRINKFLVIDSGSTLTNVGNINASVGGDILRNIDPSAGIDASCVFTTPRGYRLHVKNSHISVGKKVSAISTFAVYVCNGVTNTRLRIDMVGLNSTSSPAVFNFDSTVNTLPEKCDFDCRIDECSVIDMQATAVFNCVLERFDQRR